MIATGGGSEGGGQTKSTTARINLGTIKKEVSHESHRKRRIRGMTCNITSEEEKTVIGGSNFGNEKRGRRLQCTTGVLAGGTLAGRPPSRRRGEAGVTGW